MTVTEVEGRRLPLTNLEKVLYPATGTTKGQLLHYYAAHARWVLPHLTGRPVSFLRYPDGAQGHTFFTKNVPPGTPSWVTDCEVPRRKGASTRQVVVADLPSLMWAANLVVELHTPQWQCTTPGQADRLVIDLDPGPPATVVECCTVAQWLRERLASDGLKCWAKTSGSKGLHLLCPLERAPSETVTRYAKGIAAEAAAALPDLVTATMARSARPGRAFVDYSQNAAAKTTAAPYTVRARERPTVSAPVTWEEVASCREPGQLHFELPDMPGRLAAHGDLLAPLFGRRHARRLPDSGAAGA